ncbi:oligoribonuclease [Quercus suber]|uniref:Oligoribonuclease n=1 Tax=Quercus suber TaxID=58331 RepID=A0AAW0KYJ7_QUESU
MISEKAYRNLNITRTIFSKHPNLGNKKNKPSKKKNHRAMDDIRESIMELKYYKDNIFKASKSRM